MKKTTQRWERSRQRRWERTPLPQLRPKATTCFRPTAIRPILAPSATPVQSFSLIRCFAGLLDQIEAEIQLTGPMNWMWFTWQRRTAAWKSSRTRQRSAESSSRPRIACATPSTCSTVRHRRWRVPTARTAPTWPPSTWSTLPSARSCPTSRSLTHFNSSTDLKVLTFKIEVLT